MITVDIKDSNSNHNLWEVDKKFGVITIKLNDQVVATNVAGNKPLDSGYKQMMEEIGYAFNEMTEDGGN
jgi:hypothetical protein